MRSNWTRSPLAGLVIAALSVAAITLAIFALRDSVPVLSTGVLYLLAVLLVSGSWGLWLGLLTSLASAAAFNFFHIPPTGRFSVAEPENWLALAVYLTAAVVVSAFADAARSRAAEAEQREREADLSAELALIMLGGGDDLLERAAARIGDALGLPEVRLDEGWVDGDDRLKALPLLAASERVGTLRIPRATPPAGVDRVARRIAPALGALMDARARRALLDRELVENQALRRSDVLKTALLRAVSHDLRSPLTAIRAAAGGIDSETLSASDRAIVKDVISGEADRLTRLVDDLLALSRLESGGAQPHAEPSSIEEVVQAAADGLAPADAPIDIRLDRDLPLVRADPAQLERAISNLLENAVRYSGANPVAVRAHAHGQRLLLRITDQGPGIPPEEIEHIFEPFYRSPGARGGGSGLGLAIAKGFVESGGGRLWARSLPGQGATFGIDLPLAAAVPERAL